jgi:hypothetical protein
LIFVTVIGRIEESIVGTIVFFALRQTLAYLGTIYLLILGVAAMLVMLMMRKSTDKKKKPCKNCEGKGTLKRGDKIVRCQRCGGTEIKPS